jgi:phospho-N-acetylmuramoyl-pentapeptide-transferase
MINSVLILPVVGVLLVATSVSSALQIFSKRYLGRKIFKIAPLHHHLQALGWSREKITMRYWVISLMAAALGVIIAIVG